MKDLQTKRKVAGRIEKNCRSQRSWVGNWEILERTKSKPEVQRGRERRVEAPRGAWQLPNSEKWRNFQINEAKFYIHKSENSTGLTGDGAVWDPEENLWQKRIGLTTAITVKRGHCRTWPQYGHPPARPSIRSHLLSPFFHWNSSWCGELSGLNWTQLATWTQLFGQQLLHSAQHRVSPPPSLLAMANTAMAI